jgi:nucleoside-diphosphate-sugar epimerase
MRVAVTGGGGFLGKAIVTQLLARGDDVVSIARSDYPELRELGAQTVRADLADAEAIKLALKGADALIHTAARVGMWGPHEDFVKVNVQGTQHLLDACLAHHVPRMVFTSSPSVTFDGGDAINEGPDTPYPATYMSSYPETKAAAEQLVLAANSPELRTTSLRPHLIWGPGDPHLIPRLVERARKGKLKIVGKGDNVVDITYVDNAARAHLDALDALDRPADQPNPRGRAYYISNAEPVVLWEWINGLFKRLGIAPVTSRVPLGVAYAAGATMEQAWRLFGRGGEPPMTRFVASQLATSHWYDMTPAERDFGYAPQVSMQEGLERLLDSMKA